MTRYFSANPNGPTCAFIDSDFWPEGMDIPEGFVEITPVQHMEAMQKLGEGHKIAADEEGNLITVAPDLTPSQQFPLQLEMEQLRVTIPDAIEAMWEAMNFDVNTLPGDMKATLARKVACRAQLADLVSRNVR